MYKYKRFLQIIATKSTLFLKKNNLVTIICKRNRKNEQLGFYTEGS